MIQQRVNQLLQHYNGANDCRVVAETEAMEHSFRIDAPTDLGGGRAGLLTGERCRRPWANRGRKTEEMSARMAGGVVQPATIRDVGRVFRCEIHAAKNPDPSAAW